MVHEHSSLKKRFLDFFSFTFNNIVVLKMSYQDLLVYLNSQTGKHEHEAKHDENSLKEVPPTLHNLSHDISQGIKDGYHVQGSQTPHDKKVPGPAREERDIYLDVQPVVFVFRPNR